MPRGRDAIPDHHDRKDAQGDQKICESDDDGAGRYDQAREIDFGDHVRVADQAVAGFGQGSGEELPGQHSREHQEGVGHSLRGHFGEPAKDHDENDRGENRTEHRPQHADDCLLVSHKDVAPREE